MGAPKRKGSGPVSKDFGCLTPSTLLDARRANSGFWFRRRQLPTQESLRAS